MGLGYDYAIYRGSFFENSDKVGSIRSFSIASIYLENKQQVIKDQLSLNFGIFYVQSIEESSDYSLWITPSIDFKLNNTFAASMKYDVRLRNVQLEGLPKVNDIITYGLKASLGE